MPKRRLAALLSADVVGYSRLMAQDEAQTVNTLTERHGLLAMFVERHGGRVVDTPGDNLLAEFPSAVEAVECAIKFQDVSGERNAEQPREYSMEFRIGVHVGDVRVEGPKIYGDGVNIAARLESLAPPGAVCISGAVREHVGTKLGLEFEDLGEQQLKNFPNPIHVYRVQRNSVVETGNIPDTAPAFWERPAIAVLAFDNLSRDPDQQYLADGISEDLINHLSSWRSFPVISRHSSFVYKGKAGDLKQISRELGARYILEGSIRKAGDRIRLNVQLIDATTSHHVWAERYDREVRDIFALQDELATSIVAAMHPELENAEQERIRLREPRNLSAWEAVLRGRSCLFSIDKDNARARAFFEQAIENDPYMVAGFYGLAVSHLNDLIDGTAEDTKKSTAEIVRAADQCVALDDQDALSHLALAYAHSVTGQYKKVIADAETAARLNPSESRAYYWVGHSLSLNDRQDEAIEHLERGIRFNPRDKWRFCQGIALAHLGAGRYDEAVEWAERSLQQRRGNVCMWRARIASLALLGQVDAASAALDEAADLGLNLAVESIGAAEGLVPRQVSDRFKEGLKIAGLTDKQA